MVSQVLLRRLAFSALLFAVLSFLFTFYFSPEKVLDQREYYARVIVRQTSGVEVNSTAFIFGALVPGDSAKKQLEINNSYDFPILVQISPRQNMERFIFSQEVRVEAKEFKSIVIEASVPRGMPYGVYEGNVSVRVLKAKG